MKLRSSTGPEQDPLKVEVVGSSPTGAIYSDCAKHGRTRHFTRSDSRALRCSKCVALGVARHHRRTKLRLIEWFGGKCQRCGFDGCPAAMQFHHRDPSTKSFQVGSGNRSWARTLAEAEKCEMICANCHAEEHWRADLLEL